LYVYDTKFQTEGPLTLKVLADNGSDIHATESMKLKSAQRDTKPAR